MSFGARDLALLLPDNIGEAQNFKTTEQLKAEEDKGYEAPKPRIDASKKTRRYFPGKSPDWIPDSKEDEITFTIDGSAGTSTPAGETEAEAPVDRRLARLQQRNGATSGGRRRQRYEAEVVVEEEEPKTQGSRYELQEGRVLEGDSALLQQLDAQAEEDEEIEDESARRARIKANLLAAAALEAEERVADTREQSGEEEGSSEYETDTDTDSTSDEDENDRVLMKPVFIPRSRRETILEKEQKEDQAKALKEQTALLKEETRKHQTRVMVAESVRRQDEKLSLDAQAATDVDSDSGLPEDNDLTDDDDEEYASWKMRELKRIKVEAERREALMQERLDLERRRAMTDEERMEEDRKLGKFREKEKKKWKYLQKYYHKGVFYMDEKSTGQVGTSVLASTSSAGPSSTADYYGPGLQEMQEENEAARKAAEKKLDARLRDYSGATLEDTFDRSALPSVLQVKKFGMRGRTKYTHLVDQDTTKFGPESLGKDRHIQSNYLQKRSGVGDIDSAGKRKKKRDIL